MRRFEDFHSKIERLFKEPNKVVRCVTLQVTDSCNLACTYCYQHNKGCHFLDFETAKKFIDILLSGNNPYINLDNTSGITVDFIGGEPLLAIDLIDQISEYILTQMIRQNHPWLHRSRFSLCSNGVLYFDPKVQAYLNKYRDFISFNISIDGNKELHDTCRLFPDGSGSYDIAVEAAKDYMRKYGEIGSKMTIAPENVPYISDAVKNMLNIGYKEIYLNCAFEEGWQLNHAKTLYWQLKEVSDYLIDQNICDDVLVSIFTEGQFQPMGEDDNRNWCGGDGSMIAVDWKGDIFPCLRYMESSLGDKVKPIIIGTVDGGIEATEEQKQWVKCLQCMTRCSQSTDECINCPIASGCAWCSAYNYEYFGELNKRATHICIMHKARALANVYFWNKYYRLMGEDKKMKCHVPKEWALEIIPEEEYNMLTDLSK